MVFAVFLVVFLLGSTALILKRRKSLKSDISTAPRSAVSHIQSSLPQLQKSPGIPPDVYGEYLYTLRRYRRRPPKKPKK